VSEGAPVAVKDQIGPTISRPALTSTDQPTPVALRHFADFLVAGQYGCTLYFDFKSDLRAKQFKTLKASQKSVIE